MSVYKVYFESIEKISKIVHHFKEQASTDSLTRISGDLEWICESFDQDSDKLVAVKDKLGNVVDQDIKKFFSQVLLEDVCCALESLNTSVQEAGQLNTPNGVPLNDFCLKLREFTKTASISEDPTVLEKLVLDL